MEQHLIISIGCEYGSGGTAIGKLLSEKLGIEYFDRDFIDQIIERVGISQHVLDLADAGLAVKGISRTNIGAEGNLKYTDLTDRLVYIQKQVVKKLAERASCVIIGRCADYILRERSDVINVFIYAPIEERLKTVSERIGCTRDEAQRLIDENDAMYHARYQQITGTFRGDRHNRHLLIDSSLLGVDGTADYLDDLVRRVEFAKAQRKEEETDGK
ncbi:MAG: cytidylate kinase-like family protein [Spirochaetaceae bacterium]|nr:cytidylate kinase-like family protein [Spirochaetaceae bacterium]